METIELSNRIQRKRCLARKSRQRGMTLIEVMVVIAIIALVSGGVAVAVINNLETARKEAAAMRVQTLRGAIITYKIHHPAACPSVEDLLEAGFLEEHKSTTDPWDQDFVIACDGHRLDVYSLGPDMTEGTEDDIR